MKELIVVINDLLFECDPFKIGCKENNLVDEYISEAKSFVYNFEEGEIKNKEDIIDCMQFVLSYYWGDEVIMDNKLKSKLIDIVVPLLN